MPYRAYIDAKIRVGGKEKWLIIERLPNTGTYITKAEAEAQAKESLRYWKKHQKKGKLRGQYGDFRSRIVRK